MDLRIEKTKRSIINSFLEVRSEKEIEKVTVKEICEKAQINKSTFYSHYHDIYDLSEQLETEVVNSIIEQMSHPEYIIEKPELFTKELTKGYMSKNTLINILFSGSRSNALIHKIEKSLKELVFRKYPEYKNDAAKNITLTYCIYGGFYAYWESREYKDETVIDMIGKLSAKLQPSPLL